MTLKMTFFFTLSEKKVQKLSVPVVSVLSLKEEDTNLAYYFSSLTNRGQQRFLYIISLLEARLGLL